MQEGNSNDDDDDDNADYLTLLKRLLKEYSSGRIFDVYHRRSSHYKHKR